MFKHFFKMKRYKKSREANLSFYNWAQTHRKSHMRHIFISSTEHKHRAVAKNGRVVRVPSWQGGELISGSGAHNDDGGDEDGDEDGDDDGDEDICDVVPEHVQFD